MMAVLTLGAPIERVWPKMSHLISLRLFPYLKNWINTIFCSRIFNSRTKIYYENQFKDSSPQILCEAWRDKYSNSCRCLRSEEKIDWGVREALKGWSPHPHLGTVGAPLPVWPSKGLLWSWGQPLPATASGRWHPEKTRGLIFSLCPPPADVYAHLCASWRPSSHPRKHTGKQDFDGDI